MDRWNPGDTLFRSRDGGKTWTDVGPKTVRDWSLTPYMTFGRASASFGWWTGALALDPFHPGHAMYGTGATIWATDDLTNADTGAATHWAVGAAGVEETAVITLISPSAGAHLISGLGDIGGFRHEDLAVSPASGMFTSPVFTNTDDLDYAENVPNVVVRVGRGGQSTGAYSGDNGATWSPFAAPPRIRRRRSARRVAAPSPYPPTERRSCGRGAERRSSRAITGRHGRPAPGPAGAVALSSPTASTRGRSTLWRTVVCWSARTAGPRSRLGARCRTGRVSCARRRGMRGTCGRRRAQAVSSTRRTAARPSLMSAMWRTRSNSASEKPRRAMTTRLCYVTGQTRGGASGVFRSDDTGRTWVRINDDQHQYGYSGQAVTGRPAYLRAGVHGQQRSGHPVCGPGAGQKGGMMNR